MSASCDVAAFPDCFESRMVSKTKAGSKIGSEHVKTLLERLAALLNGCNSPTRKWLLSRSCLPQYAGTELLGLLHKSRQLCFLSIEDCVARPNLWQPSSEQRPDSAFAHLITKLVSMPSAPAVRIRAALEL